jgi:hypothetical protein
LPRPPVGADIGVPRQTNHVLAFPAIGPAWSGRRASERWVELSDQWGDTERVCGAADPTRPDVGPERSVLSLTEVPELSKAWINGDAERILSAKRPGVRHVRRKLVHQFLVVLAGTDPVVWRRIQVPERYSFWDLHVAIQDAMGWLGYHLHEFRLVDAREREVVSIWIRDARLRHPPHGRERSDAVGPGHLREPGSVFGDPLAVVDAAGHGDVDAEGEEAHGGESVHSPGARACPSPTSQGTIADGRVRRSRCAASQVIVAAMLSAVRTAEVRARLDDGLDVGHVLRPQGSIGRARVRPAARHPAVSASCARRLDLPMGEALRRRL